MIINKPLGARRDSATYVRMKKKACTEIGIASFGTDFEADVTQEQLIAKIDELNAGTASMICITSCLQNILFFFAQASISITPFI
jgi:5,10-methylene-tetrahydrofolate dehydrogenase/methenyl tetrahydrofolate cyclohydrolase